MKINNTYITLQYITLHTLHVSQSAETTQPPTERRKARKIRRRENVMLALQRAEKRGKFAARENVMLAPQRARVGRRLDEKAFSAVLFDY